MIAAIENLNKPVIKTLYGYCLGGGFEIPLGCHFRLAASEGAKIGLSEMDLGTVPAWGGSARLTQCVGRDHALDMILLAKKIDGPEALRIGLVHEVWPIDELKERAGKLAQELAQMPALAVAEILASRWVQARKPWHVDSSKNARPSRRQWGRGIRSRGCVLFTRSASRSSIRTNRREGAGGQPQLGQY